MILHYLHTAWLNMRKQAFFTFVKVLSLTIGLACSILVMMHVQYAQSYDKHFDNWQNIYRLGTDYTTDHRVKTARTAEPVAAKLALDYPQIEHIAKIKAGFGNFSINSESVGNAFYWAEKDIFKIFRVPFLEGDRETALDAPDSVVLDKSTARKIFGDSPALGQRLMLDDTITLRVTGVYQDLPENTHIDIQMFVTSITGRQKYGEEFMNHNWWLSFGHTLTYLNVRDDNAAAEVIADLDNFVSRNVPEQQQVRAKNMDLALVLEPLKDIYLSERKASDKAGDTNRGLVLAGLSLFAVLILINACINFINLTVSQIPQRMKEIGIRKTLGARSTQVYIQFLLEAFLLTFVALLIACPLIYFAIPVYTNLTDTGFTTSMLMQAEFVGIAFSFVLLTGFISGCFPALLLSKVQSAKIIKGGDTRHKTLGRSAITVVQFAFSGCLILLALAIYLQIEYLKSMDIGFNRFDLVTLDSKYNARNPDAFNYQAMVDEFLQEPAVQMVAKSATPPMRTGRYTPWKLEGRGPDDFIRASSITVDDQFIVTYQFKLLAGRGFSQQYPADFLPAGKPDADSIYGVVITKATVANFDLGSPKQALGKIIEQDGQRYRIIGVIDDFRMGGGLENTSLSTNILTASNDNLRGMSIRIDPNNTKRALDHIDAVWRKHRPDVPVNRVFYEQLFNDAISAKTNGISKAALFASTITISMAVLGLYALAFFATQRRTKEIGVRKVLGASSHSIIALLAWDFLKPIMVSCLIASLLGFYVIQSFMAVFSARVDLSVLLYMLVSGGVLFLALITVASQCFRSASADPVKSLKYE